MALLAATAVLTALAAVPGGGPGRPARAAQPSGDARATAETEPVGSESDAADDAAIWPHPTDPARSLVIGTDKRGGAVEVYDLTGERLQRIGGARANGVDLRRGFPLGGGRVDLVAVGGDDIRFFRVDPAARRLEPVEVDDDGSRVDPNGVCLYRSPSSGRFYLFGISLGSEVDQLEIVPDGDAVDLEPVRRTWDVGSDAEACVADDELGHLYVNEADVAIWRYGAEPDDVTSAGDRVAVDRTGSRGHLAADVEGLTIVYQTGGRGYLLASSQGDDSFTVYRREGDNDFVRKFEVESHSKVDGCTNTDGIDAYAGDLGPDFPHGLFICQDHHNSAPRGGNQNFKYVPLERVVELEQPSAPPAPPAKGAPEPDPGAPALPPRPAPAPAPTPAPDGGSGYWMAEEDGRVHAFGDAAHHGDAAVASGARAVDVEAAPGGYWVADDRGRVAAFGAAAHHGDLDARLLAPGERVTSLSATPSGGGYWLFTSAGRVAAFGDAASLGDMSAVALNGEVLDSVATPSGRGYYMVAADGGIFTFGDAAFAGSMGATPLNAPVRSLVADPDGAGYWLVAADGGVFAFGAPFLGSMGGVPLNRPVAGMVAFGDGYLMVGADGGIFNFSSRPFAGSLGDRPPARPVVAVAATA